MKIACFGSRFHGGQIDRIEEGFRQLGHELTPHSHEADLIYSNDPGGYQQILVDRATGRLHGKVILNVLDIPEHIPSFDTKVLANQLQQADAVTSISEWTRAAVARHCGIDSTVVYNPIKPVHRVPGILREPYSRDRRYQFVSVGRRQDENKRARLWTHAIQILGGWPSNVALVGTETWWGDYQGVLTDERLNALYNDTDFVMATGLIEGLNLPVIEAMAAGAIPVVCRDLTTREELLPSTTFPEYLEVESTPVSVARFLARFLNNQTAMLEMKGRLHAHYLANWQEKTSGLGVAKRIVQVYEKL